MTASMYAVELLFQNGLHQETLPEVMQQTRFEPAQNQVLTFSNEAVQ